MVATCKVLPRDLHMWVVCMHVMITWYIAEHEHTYILQSCNYLPLEWAMHTQPNATMQVIIHSNDTTFRSNWDLVYLEGVTLDYFDVAEVPSSLANSFDSIRSYWYRLLCSIRLSPKLTYPLELVCFCGKFRQMFQPHMTEYLFPASPVLLHHGQKSRLFVLG